MHSLGLQPHEKVRYGLAYERIGPLNEQAARRSEDLTGRELCNGDMSFISTVFFRLISRASCLNSRVFQLFQISLLPFVN